eukprot:s2321_g3.t2
MCVSMLHTSAFIAILVVPEASIAGMSSLPTEPTRGRLDAQRGSRGVYWSGSCPALLAVPAMEEAVGGEGLDRLQRCLENSGVHPDFVTQTFLEASELGDARSLKERLDGLPLEERRAFVRSVDQQGATGLLLAVKRGDVQVVKVLLDAGANPNDGDSGGATACHYASLRGSGELLQTLLQARSEPSRCDDRGDSPLAWAASEEVVALFLAAGVDPTSRSLGGRSALMFAAARGHLSAARMLAAADCDNIDAVDDAGDSAVALALANGHEEVVAMLLSFGATAVKSPGRVVLQEEVLFDAARRGDAAAIRSWLASAQGAGDVNAQEPSGDSPLLLASAQGTAEAVDLLLRARADPGQPDPFLGETPLHRAVLGGGHCDVLALLLEARADPSVGDALGKTAREVAENWSYREAKDWMSGA